jgi:hypothetical protein
MDIFPLDLVLAIAAASATIFLGFLPTRNIRSPFFMQETFKALVAWVFIAMFSPPAIRHYYFFIAILCLGSWWQFRRDRALSGKMWLSIASGLGISIGVMLILAITPRAYPADLPNPTRTLLLASIYLGGAVIGLAYVCYVLIQGSSAQSGATHDQVQRYVGLLPILVLARAGVLLALVFLTPGTGQIKYHEYNLPQTQSTVHLLGHEYTDISFGYGQDTGSSFQTIFLFGLIVVVLPVLAFTVQRAIRIRASIQAATLLAGICLAGFLAEILARRLLL